jgi:hypothetical protein
MIGTPVLVSHGEAIFACGKKPRMVRPQEMALTIEDLADNVKLSDSTPYHFARGGKLPDVKAGPRGRFHKAAIRE